MTFPPGISAYPASCISHPSFIWGFEPLRKSSGAVKKAKNAVSLFFLAPRSFNLGVLNHRESFFPRGRETKKSGPLQVRHGQDRGLRAGVPAADRAHGEGRGRFRFESGGFLFSSARILPRAVGTLTCCQLIGFSSKPLKVKKKKTAGEQKATEFLWWPAQPSGP